MEDEDLGSDDEIIIGEQIEFTDEVEPAVEEENINNNKSDESIPDRVMSLSR